MDNLNLEKYVYECNSDLLSNDDMLCILYNTKSISRKTVSETKIGYDKFKKLYTYPIIKYSLDKWVVIGIEYRSFDFQPPKNVYKLPKTPTGMTMINSYITGFTDSLCVVEGYIDGYTLLQYLTENNKDKYFHIVTASNEIQNLIKCLPEIDYSKYKKYYLYINNNEVSNKIKLQIFENYPQFEPVVINCDCKNFNEHYEKCLKGGR